MFTLQGVPNGVNLKMVFIEGSVLHASLGYELKIIKWVPQIKQSDRFIVTV